MTTTLEREVTAAPAATGARRKVLLALMLVVVVAFIALVLAFTGVLGRSAIRLPGDLTLATRLFEFTETELTADAGRVVVFVENQDLAHHDFTINEVVQLELPGKESGRAVFDVTPGTYRFYCSLHPEMEGTLRVS